MELPQDVEPQRSRTANGVLLPGDQSQFVDQILSLVRSEIRQGLDQLSVKVIEDMKGLLSSADTLLLTTSSSSLLRQTSVGQRELRLASSKTCSEMSTIHEHASEYALGAIGNEEIAPTNTRHTLPSHVTLSMPPEFDESHFASRRSDDSVQKIKTLATDIQTAQAAAALAKKDRMPCLINDSRFNNFCMLVILFNAIWMGYESDYPGDGEGGWQSWVSKSITIWFIFELLLKILVLRRDFIFGHDSAWNFFDALCVLSSIPDLFSSSMNLSFFRLFRLAKLTRSLWVVRMVHILKSLRKILMIVFHTMESLFWSFVAILFVSYLFALLFMQLVSTSEETFRPDTMHSFKDMLSAMTALFSFITGGLSWYPFALDFHEHGAHLAEMALLFYVFFMLFGLVNVVIATFCAQAEEVSQARSDLRIEQDKDQAEENLREWMDMFKMIDTESKGYLTWYQFRKFGHDTDGEHLFQSHGLCSFVLGDIWDIMEGYTEAAGGAGAGGAVDVTGFIMGFMRLSHLSRSSNLILLSREMERVWAGSRDMTRQLQDAVILIRELHQPFIQEARMKETRGLGRKDITI